MEPSRFRVHVDESRISSAVTELYSALAAQSVAWSQHFERGIFSPKSQKLIRGFALTLCAVGIGLSLYVLATVPVGCGSFGFGLICLAVFGLLGMVFYRMLELQESMQSRLRKWTGKKLLQRAAKALSAMRDAGPVDIEYTLEDDQVRGQWYLNGEPDRSWKRKLDAFAYVGETMCAIFSKRTAFHPRVIMLHSDRRSVEELLVSRGVEVAPLPPELPEEYMLALS